MLVDENTRSRARTRRKFAIKRLFIWIVIVWARMIIVEVFKVDIQYQTTEIIAYPCSIINSVERFNDSP